MIDEEDFYALDGKCGDDVVRLMVNFQSSCRRHPLCLSPFACDHSCWICGLVHIAVLGNVYAKE